MVNIRRIAGLAAIVALALTYSEALGTAFCSMMRSGSATMAMPMPDAPVENDSQQPSDDCPLSMPGSPTSCIFSLAVLSDSPAQLVQHDARITVITHVASPYQLLLARSAFHPPKV